jgi:DNA gyrase subunit B
LDLPPLALDQLIDQDQVRNWLNRLEEIATQKLDKGTTLTTSVHHDKEQSLYFPIITIREHGTTQNYLLKKDFFNSLEYKTILHYAQNIKSLVTDTAYIKRNEQTYPVKNIQQAMSLLLNEAKKGLNIQRYKGLGEMNPEQLWETTMNPETRRLLLVRIEDAVATDEMFTTLMGDQVEPRRHFIEQNALEVENLDV